MAVVRSGTLSFLFFFSMMRSQATQTCCQCCIVIPPPSSPGRSVLRIKKMLRFRAPCQTYSCSRSLARCIKCVFYLHISIRERDTENFRTAAAAAAGRSFCWCTCQNIPTAAQSCMHACTEGTEREGEGERMHAHTHIVYTHCNIGKDEEKGLYADNSMTFQSHVVSSATLKQDVRPLISNLTTPLSWRN